MEGNQVGGSDARAESPRLYSRRGCWEQNPGTVPTLLQLRDISYWLVFLVVIAGR
jgi:hypothetical protein